MLFDVAPADAHAVTAAALKSAGAHVPRACLLRRIVADFGAQPSFQEALAAGGLRSDRLSVWALQVSVASCWEGLGWGWAKERQSAVYNSMNACLAPPSSVMLSLQFGQHDNLEHVMCFYQADNECRQEHLSGIVNSWNFAAINLALGMRVKWPLAGPASTGM